MNIDLFIKKMQEIYRLSNLIAKYETQIEKFNVVLNERMNEIFALLDQEEKEKTREKEKTKYINCENSKIS